MKKVASQSERLNELMRMYDISQSELAKRCGLSKASLSLYMSDKRNIGGRSLERISQYFGIYAEWLLGYNCPMNKADAVECMLETEHESDERLRRFMLMYSKLNDSNRDLVDNLISGLTKNENRKEK